MIADEIRSWVGETWDPDAPVRDWWSELADAGLSSPILPAGSGGRGWPRADAQQVNVELATLGVLGPPLGVGLTLVAPTLVKHASAEVAARLIRPIVDGTAAWCQLYSEPGAGSDLAGLSTTAQLTSDGWRVHGTKTWTSGADTADYGFLLARTDPGAPKHRGISAFAIDMHQPGVEIRPLRQMTGRSGFSTVTLDGPRVAPDGMIGEPGDGWAIAKAMLAEERASYRAAGSGSLITARPGSAAGDLHRRAGSITTGVRRHVSNVISESEVRRIIELARQKGRTSDLVVRQHLARLVTLTTISRFNEERSAFDGAANIAKLLISDTFRVTTAAATLVGGMDAALDGPQSRTSGWLQELMVFSPGPAVYGGTDQIQRNILAERVLGLARDWSA